MEWRRSSRCDSSACVEVAWAGPTTVWVRDSEDPDGPVLEFDPQAWEQFIDWIRRQ
jgi:hypothetical protein